MYSISVIQSILSVLSALVAGQPLKRSLNSKVIPAANNAQTQMLIINSIIQKYRHSNYIKCQQQCSIIQ